MTQYIVANWKSQKTWPAIEQWLETFLNLYRPDPNLRVIIAPAAVYLWPLAQRLKRLPPGMLFLASQDISPFPLGSYTGAVAAEMLSDLAQYAIIGHTERRRYFHESHQEIANKVSEAAAAGLRPILCLDRPYAAAQLAALDEENTKKLLIGYGPEEAIGLAIPPQSTEQVGLAIQAISTLIPDRRVLYGGSINSDNARHYMQINGVAGLMVGTTSLDPVKFNKICQIVSQTSN